MNKYTSDVDFISKNLKHFKEHQQLGKHICQLKILYEYLMKIFKQKSKNSSKDKMEEGNTKDR